MFRPFPYTTQSLPRRNGFTFVIRELGRQINSPKMFAGQSRVETITDVKFVDKNHVVVGHRDQKMLYLVEVDHERKQARVLDRLYLVFGYPRDVTLIHVAGKTIYLTFLTPFIGVVQIENNRLVKKGLYMMKDLRHGYHGVHRKDNLLYLAGAMSNPVLVLYNLDTNESQSFQLPGLEGINIKQTQLLDDYIVVSACDGHISDIDPNCTYDGYVGVYRKDTYEKVDLIHLPVSQMDDLRVDKGRIFFVRQGPEDYGQVLQYKLENEKLVKVKEYRVGQFPHGLDIYNDVIACTSMKDSAISFFPA